MTEKEQQVLLPMSTGADLRAVREARKLSLDEVAERIRCPRRVLEAIETDQPAGIAPVYLKGHLRRYAELLELDRGSLDALLEAHQGEAPPVQTVFETRPPTQASDRWLRVASYVLGSLLVGTLAWQMTHEAVRLARVDHTVATEPASSEDAGPAAGAAHVNASIASLERLRTPSGSRTADAGAQAWGALNEARRAREALVAGEHLLELETSADSWVEIIGTDGERLEQDLLRGGEHRSYRGDGPFRISLGHASAVRLALDGQSIDLAPHTRENVARLLLDPAAIAASGVDEEGNAPNTPAEAEPVPEQE